MMDMDVARGIAHYSHMDGRDRFGDPVIEHVERVAASVPPGSQTVAFLHDVLEWTSVTLEELSAQGLTPVEQEALELLTREPDESYELYILRIAWARGEAGAIARAVKLADLDDHIAHAHGSAVRVPPYAWARRHIVVAEERCTA